MYEFRKYIECYTSLKVLIPFINVETKMGNKMTDFFVYSLLLGGKNSLPVVSYKFLLKFKSWWKIKC